MSVSIRVRIVGVLTLALAWTCMGCAANHESRDKVNAWEESGTAEIQIDESLLHGSMFEGEPFYGRRPCLYLDGNIYYWDGLSYPNKYVPGNFSLEDYTEVDTLKPVTEAPRRNGEFWGPEMEGSVYVSPQTPDVVYLWAYSEAIEDWEEGHYVRMSTIVLQKGGNNQLYLYGKRYYFFQSGDVMEESLPEGYEAVGTAVYIGEDLVPENDFETNSRTGEYGTLMDGKEIYYNAESPELIFIPTEDMKGKIWYYGVYAEIDE